VVLTERGGEMAAGGTTEGPRALPVGELEHDANAGVEASGDFWIQWTTDEAMTPISIYHAASQILPVPSFIVTYILPPTTVNPLEKVSLPTSIEGRAE
jgi:hypothetical protein